ncbi:M23 family metallopeptidase [Streptomyces clavuligerus]|uniref:M23 family metallopeptidase n=1 Tax=Streptomyces clavuligerus TaxID=1901 RepID=UPI000185164D|nr:M23 family metallopeptidase [Streptomyces clavuligerus]MBY6303054.1 M23 family metallopeptidase [Streptomyces clavuligerus]QPL63190.1 M23 family metallopeptidase [Streptomyces clavuligerus]QPL69216.1 M23 family metallopeptidase [Streptomyces clavuligerus]QPL75300.1 M23 family metallopeptidase [Streptomyces clavuligerus]QPL81324.1 M23 family metallopeptidase [Streptomyces clavuligerus]
MNDQHAHAGHVGHDDYTTGSFGIDPLFGALPDGTAGYGAGHSGQYDSTTWDTGAHQGAGYAYDGYAAPEQAGQYPAAGYDGTGQWDAAAWNQAQEAAPFEAVATAFAYDTTGQWAAASFDTGAYDATAWNSDGAADPATGAETSVPHQYAPEQEFTEYGTEQEFAEYAATPGADLEADLDTEYGAGYEPDHDPGYRAVHDTGLTDPDDLTDLDGPDGPQAGGGRIGDTASLPVVTDDDTHAYTPEPAAVPGPAADGARPVRRSGGNGGRGRRRTPAKRSALLTVAVPSVCVMGVAGIAAASVGSLTGGDDSPKTAAKVTPVDPAVTAAKTAAANSRMDTQLAALSAGARDFGDRASRTQERIDLKARQEADRKKREEEAKRREALRPKFAVPVESRGLSTYYGESGVNWMALHTGIDFPVPYGTNVFAATDGTIRTQYNTAYGNMIILTAPDGTETWYCHLSSAKIRSGAVKAGDVIGYAGNSGNSTGPHLHFEVRPGGGSTIDPLAWLQSKGLDPR